MVSPINSMPSRRLARMGFSSSLLKALCAGIYEVVSNPLPQDSEIRGVSYDIERDLIVLLIESKEFDPIMEGDYINWAKSPTVKKLGE